MQILAIWIIVLYLKPLNTQKKIKTFTFGQNKAFLKKNIDFSKLE